nr:uncharacterized protein LOC109771300 [Aegilops tauschii subsp. strangulata]
MRPSNSFSKNGSTSLLRDRVAKAVCFGNMNVATHTSPQSERVIAAPNRTGGSGRRKTVIRRIEQDDAPHVCFSKGRVGFFSKFSDLAVLTGAQVAALTFLPGGNAYSFGHRSVDPIVERFLVGRVRGLVKKRTERDEVTVKEPEAGEPIAAWVDPNVREMGDEDMAAFFAALMQVKHVVSERANKQEQQMLMATLSPAEAFASGINMQQQMVMELPPAQGVTAEMDMQEMPPPLVFTVGMDMEEMQMVIPQPPGFDDDMGMPPSPEIPAGLETNAGCQFPY